MTLKNLSARYGLSPKQTRRVWEAVRPLLSPYTQRGPHNVTLISEQAIPILDRFMELLREGLSVPAASEKLHEEMKSSGPAQGTLPASNGHSQGDPRDELIAILKAQLAEKDCLIADLLNSVRDLQMKALPPAAPRLSRWQALKIAILGR